MVGPYNFTPSPALTERSDSAVPLPIPGTVDSEFYFCHYGKIHTGRARARSNSSTVLPNTGSNHRPW